MTPRRLRRRGVDRGSTSRVGFLDRRRGRLEVQQLRDTVIHDAVNDVVGVYEVWWSANAMWPDKPLSERLRLAEAAVTSALDDGLIAIEVGEWGDATTAVDDMEARRLLEAWETWTIPDGPKVFLWRTSKGIDHVMRGSA